MFKIKARKLINSRIPLSRCLKRNYSYHYNYQQQYKPRTSFAQKFLYTIVGSTVISGYCYYMFWPKHTFPKSVAKILRKGLWAESERGEFDYQLALKYYIEALLHCKEINMDPLSDEYTGIQLKIAEMYERLNMLSDAGFVLNEIATLYLSALTAKDSKLSRDRRRHLIQKDLRIALKLVELNKLNPQLSKAILITHLIIAQDEVNKMSKGKGLNLEEGASSGGTFKAVPDSDAIIINDELGKEVGRVEKTPEIWYPFTDEFFNCMDLLSAICISTGDLSMATKIKISMCESMLLADIEPFKMLLSQCNLGGLLYMQAEEIEGQEIRIKKGKEEIDKPESELEKLAKSREVCINLAIKSYSSVLEFAKTIPKDVISENNEILETVALATYGLGVINLHLQNYDKAERLLRESRVRSRQCNYGYLIPEIERELGKLFKERKEVKEGKDPRRKKEVNDIEMDIHLK
ncbi:unnamed protein product [Candida verbasci]|uniref:Mitochondrial inner membrane i-AAA protease supercomplex subunit MGR3 n=1 Tax=Candida verbasci TaxID=1227364 RepID=A0A9W4X875_9ASCO|nr:unnamed protein product [Candida verbasci]